MLKNLTFAELEDWCEGVGERRQRARQLWRWMYADGALIRDISQATGVVNGFSSAFLCALCLPSSPERRARGVPVCQPLQHNDPGLRPEATW